MPRIVTASQLETAVRRRTDTITDTHVSQAEIFEYLSNWRAELYEILVNSGLFYHEEKQQITSTGVASYDLTSYNILSIMRVDYVVSNDDVRPVIEIDIRDVHRVSRSVRERAMFFRHIKDTIYFYPPPPTGQIYELIYIPNPGVIDDGADQVDGVMGWEDFLITGASMDVLAKQDRHESMAVQDKRMNDPKNGIRARIVRAAQTRGNGQARSLIQRSPQAEDFLGWEDALWWEP